MKRFLLFFLVLVYFHGHPANVYCQESYYIDGQTVLLYKIINWWYDCLPEEDGLYCGKTIKCMSQGDAQIQYSEAEMTMKISVNGGLADLLSVFRQCERCSGPSRLYCVWQNEKYLGKVGATELSNLKELVFKKVSRKNAHFIKTIQSDLAFMINGTIGGLQNDGTIALYQTDSPLKGCPDNSGKERTIQTISLDIVNAKTSEIIAKYSTKALDSISAVPVSMKNLPHNLKVRQVSASYFRKDNLAANKLSIIENGIFEFHSDKTNIKYRLINLRNTAKNKISNDAFTTGIILSSGKINKYYTILNLCVESEILKSFEKTGSNSSGKKKRLIHVGFPVIADCDEVHGSLNGPAYFVLSFDERSLDLDTNRFYYEPSGYDGLMPFDDSVELRYSHGYTHVSVGKNHGE